MIKFLKAHWKSILWAFFIFILCHLPGKDLPKVTIIGIDKVVHFILFATITFITLFIEN